MRPVLSFLAFPLLIFTLGLFTFVLNAVMLLLTGALASKLKVRPGWDVEPVSAVRADHPDLRLAVDANGSFGQPGALRSAWPWCASGSRCS